MINLKTTSGVLAEIEATLNRFQDSAKQESDYNSAHVHLRACKHAIQIHTLNFMWERYETVELPNAAARRSDLNLSGMRGSSAPVTDQGQTESK